MATKMAIYFCDRHSPGQRGTNKNTNGPLLQYFPKGTDLYVHSPERLLEVPTELNNRPRKTLGGITPTKPCSDYCQNQKNQSSQRPVESANPLWDTNPSPKGSANGAEWATGASNAPR
jgi:hypothetical protein